jgi:hypothetical protein
VAWEEAEPDDDLLLAPAGDAERQGQVPQVFQARRGRQVASDALQIDSQTFSQGGQNRLK